MNVGLILLHLFFLRNCIECLGFNSGPLKDNCREACSSITPNKVDRLSAGGKQCELKDSESCWIKFRLEQLVGADNYYAVIQSERGKMENIVDISSTAPNTKRIGRKAIQYSFIPILEVCETLSSLFSSVP